MSTKGSAPSSIEWHDSPKFTFNKSSSRLRSKAPEIIRSDSEQKFNAEFDKWFAVGSEDISTSFCYTSGESQSDKIDLTPPVLRIRCGTVRPISSAVSACTSTKILDDDSNVEDGSTLVESLLEGKETIKRLIEKRRRSSSVSSSLAKPQTTNDALIDPTKAAMNHHLSHRTEDQRLVNENGAAENEDSPKVVPECKWNSTITGPCTSTQIVSSTALDVHRRIVSFGKDGLEEPSPITPTGSRKRKRGRLSTIQRRKDDSTAVRTSSEDDDDMGAVESTPLSSRRIPTHLNTRQREPVSSSAVNHEEKAGSDYDSMDDETLNVLLSQMPIEPSLSRPCGSQAPEGQAKTQQESACPRERFLTGGMDCVTTCPQVKPKVCVVQVCPTTRSSNERTPFRRCRTFDASPRKEVKVGGWNRRISAVAGRSTVSNENSNAKVTSETSKEEGIETMPRSASFEPPKSDSFWDDDEFEGIDFKAIDAVE